MPVMLLIRLGLALLGTWLRLGLSAVVERADCRRCKGHIAEMHNPFTARVLKPGGAGPFAGQTGTNESLCL